MGEFITKTNKDHEPNSQGAATGLNSNKQDYLDEAYDRMMDEKAEMKFENQEAQWN